MEDAVKAIPGTTQVTRAKGFVGNLACKLIAVSTPKTKGEGVNTTTFLEVDDIAFRAGKLHEQMEIVRKVSGGTEKEIYTAIKSITRDKKAPVLWDALSRVEPNEDEDSMFSVAARAFNELDEWLEENYDSATDSASDSRDLETASIRALAKLKAIEAGKGAPTKTALEFGDGLWAKVHIMVAEMAKTRMKSKLIKLSIPNGKADAILIDLTIQPTQPELETIDSE